MLRIILKLQATDDVEDMIREWICNGYSVRYDKGVGFVVGILLDMSREWGL